MTGNVLPGNLAEQEESSIMESQKKQSSEWTNVKHSLYLKSIEASFINQLYNSLDMQSRQTQKTSSSQFKVLQGGCWSNKKLRGENENPQPKHSKRSNNNPWIRHFTKASPFLQERLLSDLACSNTEVTDQNFVEDLSMEKADRPNNRKRKTVANSSNDQLVRFVLIEICLSGGSFLPHISGKTLTQT
ncbi:hypothetical protein LXL04_008131 [Taraxacum kok-saghyz]